MAKIKVRKGMPSVQLDKQEFKKRFWRGSTIRSLSRLGANSTRSLKLPG
jgi:hypothetical protein